jgi:hypothetical protein
LLAQSSADPEVLLELVRAYLKAGNYDQALAVANQIKDPDIRLEVLNLIMEKQN